MLIITATRAAIGICLSQGPASRIIASRLTPENRVESRVRPPLSTFITDWPTRAQPAMPPNRDATIFAMPWPRASTFLLVVVSVLSSRMSWVRKVSIKPTREMARAVGRTSPRVSKLKGTPSAPKGRLNDGRPAGRVPRLLTVGMSKLKPTLIAVSTMMATSCDGTTRVSLGRP